LQFWTDAAPDLLINHILDPKLRAFYLSTYSKIGYILDPFFILALGTKDYSVSQLRDIAPDRFETSEYYHQYYAETGLVDELGAVIRVAPNIILHLSLGRMRDRGRFRAQDRKYFELLAPVIMRKLKSLQTSSPGPQESRNDPNLTERYQHLSGHNDHPLSRREAEIAALIVQGHSSRAVGLRLKISDQTVKVHRRNIYKKLNISSQNELFSLLIRDM
jgi:DNA-binding CsgD family transcriptional regulator